jgi:hypothetical protein
MMMRLRVPKEVNEERKGKVEQTKKDAKTSKPPQELLLPDTAIDVDITPSELNQPAVHATKSQEHKSDPLSDAVEKNEELYDFVRNLWNAVNVFCCYITRRIQRVIRLFGGARTDPRFKS